MTRSKRALKAQLWITAAAVFGGGTLAGTCELRARQAAIDGTKSFVANVLLNPTAVEQFFTTTEEQQ